ncbi:hypothetical protein ABG067_005341 [Albugo candida]|uniref:Uncharacterized protein n=1 Tax=Albugo candida TaxID=65357 RepID=A0A024GNQ1_9STRA|nr:unnamed protein product [Albugo candida]|eukprot:CCI48509.1 unnamed protein product [Albugo candida]
MGAYCCLSFRLKRDYQPKKTSLKQNFIESVSQESGEHPDTKKLISDEIIQRSIKTTEIDRLEVSQYRCTCEDCPRMKIIMAVTSCSILFDMEKCTSDTTRQRLQRVLLAYLTYDETRDTLDPKVVQLAHELVIERKLKDDDAFRNCEIVDLEAIKYDNWTITRSAHL